MIILQESLVNRPCHTNCRLIHHRLLGTTHRRCPNRDLLIVTFLLLFSKTGEKIHQKQTIHARLLLDTGCLAKRPHCGNCTQKKKKHMDAAIRARELAGGMKDGTADTSQPCVRAFLFLVGKLMWPRYSVECSPCLHNDRGEGSRPFLDPLLSGSDRQLSNCAWQAHTPSPKVQHTRIRGSPCAAWVVHVVVEMLQMSLQQGIGMGACHQPERLCAKEVVDGHRSPTWQYVGGSGAHACIISSEASRGVWCKRCGGWAVTSMPWGREGGAARRWRTVSAHSTCEGRSRSAQVIGHKTRLPSHWQGARTRMTRLCLRWWEEGTASPGHTGGVPKHTQQRVRPA